MKRRCVIELLDDDQGATRYAVTGSQILVLFWLAFFLGLLVGFVIHSVIR